MQERSAHDYADGPEARQELLAFLDRPDAPQKPACPWADRLHHWWDENPFAGICPQRGYVLRQDGEIGGFVGVIPTAYAWQGAPLPVLLTSTFDLKPEFFKQGHSVLLRLRSLLREASVFHTTPSPHLWHILVRMKARAETQAVCDYHPRGRIASWWRNGGEKLDSGISLTTSLDAVRALARPYQNAERIEKWRSLEALRWQLTTPTRLQFFLGAVDSEGVLHSFLILSPCDVRGLPALEVIDYFTTRDDLHELHALADLLTRHDSSLNLPRTPLWIVRSFPGDETWAGRPGLLHREHTVCHFFMLPPYLREAPKRSVMAEGDLVL